MEEGHQLSAKHLVNFHNEEMSKKALPITWVFQSKQFPNSLIQKLEAWLCVCGDRQVHGVDFFKSYALVIHWTTI